MKKLTLTQCWSRRVAVGAFTTAAVLWLSPLKAATYLETGGRVVVEAEHFDTRTVAADGHHWHITPDEDAPGDLPPTIHGNARGSQIICIPDGLGGGHSSTTTWNTDPFVDYKVHIETPGLYRMWLRWRGWDGAADSMYAQILELKDGTGGAIADWWAYFANSGAGFNGNWRGSGVREIVNATGTTSNCTYNITAPGTYTIRLSYREDGCSVDTVMLQLDSLASPGDPGPAESIIIMDEPFINGRTPGINAGNVAPFTAYQVQIHDGRILPLNAEDPVFSLNGTPLTFVKTKTGTTTTLNAASVGLLARDSTNTLALVFKDSAGTSYTNEWQFTTGAGVDLPPAFRLDPSLVSTSPGFTVNGHQVIHYTNGVLMTANLAGTVDRAEGQIRGYLLAPDTGLSYTNNVPTANNAIFGDGNDDYQGLVPETYINFNTRSFLQYSGTGAEIGNFRYDSTAPNAYGFPDIFPPGYGARVDTTIENNMAYEIITYVEFPAGLTRMGVNSDDGFRVTCGIDYRQRYDTNKVLLLGQFDGNRSPGDTVFDLYIQEAGIYPIRLIWFNTGSGGGVELFTFAPDGTRIPINDIPVTGTWQAGNPLALKAYRSATITNEAVIDWLYPVPNSVNVSTGAAIQVQLADVPGDIIDKGSIKLLLNGSVVTPAVTNDGPRTRLFYLPASPLAFESTNVCQVEFTDSMGHSVTQAWQFVMQTAPIAPPAGGELTRKIWTGMTATSIATFKSWGDVTNNVNYNMGSEPTVITAFETPQTSPAVDNYGEHIFGYLKPEVTDWYTFYLASDDQSELWLSTNASPAGVSTNPIAFTGNATGYREFITGRYVYSRRSQPTFLEAGKKYYVEAFFREGTGSDFISVAWWRTNDIPVTNGTPGLAGAVLEKFVGAAFKRHPASLRVLKGRPATFSVEAVIGVGTITYQWLKDGNDVPSANPMYLSIPATQMSDAGKYRLRITVDGVQYLSDEATLQVTDDMTPPSVLSIKGMNDSVLATWFGPAHTIAIEFNESIDPVSVNAATITLSGGLGINAVQMLYSNKVAGLQVSGPVPSTFTATFNGVADPAGNVVTGTFNGSAAQLTPMILGLPGTDPVDYTGTVAYGINSNGYMVTANGSDLWNTNDAGHYAYTTWTGNFDMRVRVEDLTMANAWSKAGLMARDDLVPNARNAAVLVAPAAGQNVYTVQWRSISNTIAVAKATAERITGVPYPNAWVRLVRQSGTTFVAFINTNGVDWLPYHRYVAPEAFPETLYVGLATTSHDNVLGDLTTATYRDFSIQSYTVSPPTVGSYGADTNGAFQVTFSAPLGQSWQVLSSTNVELPLAQWTPLGTGLVTTSPVTFTDTSNTNYPTRFYRVTCP